MSTSSVPLAGLLPGRAEWAPVTHGESGATVLHDAAGGRYAKVVPFARADLLAAERDRTQWLPGAGVPGPAVLDWRTSEHGACLVTSAVAGVPADQLDPARLRAAWPSVADTVRRLHSAPSCPFDNSLDGLMAVAREAVAEDRVHTEFLPEHL